MIPKGTWGESISHCGYLQVKMHLKTPLSSQFFPYSPLPDGPTNLFFLLGFKHNWCTSVWPQQVLRFTLVLCLLPLLCEKAKEIGEEIEDGYKEAYGLGG